MIKTADKIKNADQKRVILTQDDINFMNHTLIVETDEFRRKKDILLEEIKRLGKQYSAISKQLKCNHCPESQNTKENRVLPKYIKVKKGTKTIEMEFGSEEAMNQFILLTPDGDLIALHDSTDQGEADTKRLLDNINQDQITSTITLNQKRKCGDEDNGQPSKIRK